MPVQTICCVCQKSMSLYGWFDEFMEQYKKLSKGYCPECFRQTMNMRHPQRNRQIVTSHSIWGELSN